MDNFKRFLTYINSYTRGELVRNVGSSKIELRDNTCRITVNAKELMNIDIEDVYLFRRENNNMIITYLGKLSYSNGNYELRIETKADNILNTGYGFQDFSGVILLREKNVEIIEKPQQIYAGIWDNKPLGKTISKKSIQTEQAREVTYKVEEKKGDTTSLLEKIGNLVTSKKDKLAMASTDSKVNDIKMNQSQINEWKEKNDQDKDMMKEFQEQDLRVEEVRDQDLRIEEVQNEVIVEEFQDQDMIEEEIQDQDITIPDDIFASHVNESKRYEESNNVNEEDASLNENRNKIVDKQEDNTSSNNPVNEFVGGNKDKEEKNMSIANVVDQNFVHLKNAVEVIKSNQTNETIIGNIDTSPCVDEKLDCMNVRLAKVDELREKFKDEKKKEMTDAEKKVRYILQVYPKMNPFEDGCECVRIEPQDLFGLPISIWMPVNNNFLRNGYNKFKHLVLTRNGSDYVIGVPGIKNEKEQFMAYLHGFTYFKPLKKIDNVSEEFGYWVVKINI